MLKEAVEYFVAKGFSDNYTFSHWAIDYCFEQYPFYTAKRLINLATIKDFYKPALAIVNAHNLLQKTIDSNPEILQEVAKTGNFETLKVLAEYGANFSSPNLFDSALATEDLAYIHFMLNHQKGILQQRPELYDSLPNLISFCDFSSTFNENPVNNRLLAYNFDYAKDVYKTFLHVQNGDNIQVLKDVIFSFDNEMKEQNKNERKYYEIQKKIDDRLFDKENMQLLIKMFLDVQTYPDFLNKLIVRIERNQEKNKKGYSVLLKQLLEKQEWFSIASGPDIHAIGLWTYFCSEGNFKTLLFSYLWLRIFMSGAFSLGFLKSFDLKDQEKQMEKTNQEINLSYLNGYLQGLQILNNNNLEITNQQNYKRRFEKIGKKQYFQYLAFSLGFSMLTSYALGVNFWALAAMTAGSGGIYISDKLEQFKKEHIQKLLDDSLKRGKEDGIARKEFDKEPILAELISPDVVSLTKASLKAIFGNIITFSKKLFGFMSHITEYKIRNRNPS